VALVLEDYKPNIEVFFAKLQLIKWVAFAQHEQTNHKYLECWLSLRSILKGRRRLAANGGLEFARWRWRCGIEFGFCCGCRDGTCYWLAASDWRSIGCSSLWQMLEQLCSQAAWAAVLSSKFAWGWKFRQRFSVSGFCLDWAFY
jgi:hypothetical protein